MQPRASQYEYARRATASWSTGRSIVVVFTVEDADFLECVAPARLGRREPEAVPANAASGCFVSFLVMLDFNNFCVTDPSILQQNF